MKTEIERYREAAKLIHEVVYFLFNHTFDSIRADDKLLDEWVSLEERMWDTVDFRPKEAANNPNYLKEVLSTPSPEEGDLRQPSAELEERDFTPEEALTEAQRRWGGLAHISMTGHVQSRFFYAVSNKPIGDKFGHSIISFRVAFAQADAQAEASKGEK